jgi:hypothetical protein
MAVVTFAAEVNVATYNLQIDGGADIPVTPATDGTATFDMGPLNLTAGPHTVAADACNPSGCSAYCAAVSFTIAEPVPAVPVISVA